jgi:hypothetical protein
MIHLMVLIRQAQLHVDTGVCGYAALPITALLCFS